MIRARQATTVMILLVVFVILSFAEKKAIEKALKLKNEVAILLEKNSDLFDPSASMAMLTTD